MKNVPPEPPTTTVAESLKGKTGIVVRDISSDSYTDGKVKIESTMWSATARTAIKSGTKVKVVESEGVHVIVEPISDSDENDDEEKKKDVK